MSRLTRGILALALLAPTAPVLRAQSVQYPSDVPQIVIDGLTTYQSKDLRSALGVWLKGSPLSSSETIEQMAGALAPIEASYGRMTGDDVLRVVSISPVVRRVYAVIRYERGPLFAYFDCYKTSDAWIIPAFLTHTRASEILPASVLYGDD